MARRHRTPVAAAIVAILAGIVGLSAVLAVQARANSNLSASLARETAANRAFATANADLDRSRTAVQSRYDLAVEAIKTFHTGVSEDFLVKQDQFKHLRDRLLKSASEFYGKLAAMLGTETDAASQVALSHANFELAELTSKVGDKQNALAAHRQLLATRRSLAAKPAATIATKADVAESLSAVAHIQEQIGASNDSIKSFREAESLLLSLVNQAPQSIKLRSALRPLPLSARLDAACDRRFAGSRRVVQESADRPGRNRR